jgi:pre-mRNA-splicing factor CWC26
MSNMQRYLAEKYMSGPKADAILARDPTVKKKKRKHGTQQPKAGIGIVDDDAGWGRPIRTEEDEDDAVEAVVASDRSFKKRKVATEDGGGGGWVSLPPSGENQEAEPEDEKPVIVNEPQRAGGLMTHADLQKQFATQMSVQNSKDDEPTPEQQETVYRDASGRKIDTKAAKAEAARRKREEEEREAKKMEWGKGIVQREETERRRREMELERGKGFERYVDH